MARGGTFSAKRKLSRDPDEADFLFRERKVVKTEGEELLLELLKERVDVFFGVGAFLDPHRIEVQGERPEVLYGENILVVSGSYPAHPPGIPFDGRSIHDSDTILQIERIPRSLCVVGAGTIGCEYATELIHYGMEMVENRETIGRVLSTVFNFPSLHELYKCAAYKIWTSKLEAPPAAPRPPAQGQASSQGVR